MIARAAFLLLLAQACFCARPTSWLGWLFGGRQLEDGRTAGAVRAAETKLTVPQATHFGFLPVNPDKGSEMFFMYYEAREQENDLATTPIVLWLQGGPGCSSLFGMIYINGPYFVNDDLTLRVNHGSWNRLYGMLFIEQPLGVGFSKKGKAQIPDNELDVAWDLYRGLQSFYRTYPEYQQRPLIVTGESYAGKYAPSIAHFILQADALAKGYISKVKHARDLGGREVEAPVFPLGGVAVGNGFTDAETQTAVQAEVAFNMGLIGVGQRRHAEAMQAQIIDMVRSKQWRAARQLSDQLLAFIANASGSATLEDIRRHTPYDGPSATDRFLNLPHVRAAIHAPDDIEWVGCSNEVDRVFGHDIMRSVKHLVEDLLSFKPVLLYQGQFDAECGVASNEAWINSMRWRGHMEWANTERRLWYINARIAGYWKQLQRLTQVVIRNTGHMVPHDNPLYGQVMLEKWVEEEVLGREYTREVTPEMEREYANPDQGDQST